MTNFRNAGLVLIGLFPLTVVAALGCRGRDHSFQRSHDSIRIGMSIRQVFESGLADYLMRMRNKNVPGGTVREKQPVSNTYKRHVLDIYYFEPSFLVRVYCDMNSPSAPQVIPERSFRNKEEFLHALDMEYRSWSRSVEFRVASPPKRLFGVYDHYNFTTDQEGKVITISPIIASP